MFLIRFKRLAYLSLISLLCNYKSNASSISYLRTKLQTLLHTRKTQETCTESTCDRQTSSISLRITPIQDKLTEAEEFVKQCVLEPDSLKKFKQFGNHMFVGRACLENILVLKNSPLIESIEGGTKTTKSKKMRMNPKEVKVLVDCNGACCKDCESNKVHEIIATLTEPVVGEDGLNLLKDCNMASTEPALISINPMNGKSFNGGQRYSLSVCKNDKHILKNSEYVEDITRIGPTSSPGSCKEGTCCKACVASNPEEVMYISAVVKSGKATTFLQSCATSEVTLVDEATKQYSTTICKDDYDTVKKNSYLASVEGVEDEGEDSPTNSTDTGEDDPYLDTNSTDTSEGDKRDKSPSDTNSTDTGHNQDDIGDDDVNQEDYPDTNSTGTGDNNQDGAMSDTNSTETDDDSNQDDEMPDTNSTDTGDNNQNGAIPDTNSTETDDDSNQDDEMPDTNSTDTGDNNQNGAIPDTNSTETDDDSNQNYEMPDTNSTDTGDNNQDSAIPDTNSTETDDDSNQDDEMPDTNSTDTGDNQDTNNGQDGDMNAQDNTQDQSSSNVTDTRIALAEDNPFLTDAMIEQEQSMEEYMNEQQTSSGPYGR